jgi:hypothetical protein
MPQQQPLVTTRPQQLPSITGEGHVIHSTHDALHSGVLCEEKGAQMHWQVSHSHDALQSGMCVLGAAATAWGMTSHLLTCKL